MNHISAVSISKHNYAVRGLGDTLEIYDGDSRSFFTYCNGEIARKPGRGSVAKEDWDSGNLHLIRDKIEAFKADQEGRPIIPLQSWQAACEKSPVKRAWRDHEKFGNKMLRDMNGNTWYIDKAGQYVSQIAGPFKHWDGWQPVDADDPTNVADLTSSQKSISLVRAKPKNYTQPEAPLVIVSDAALNASVVMAQTLQSAMTEASASDKTKIVDELLRLSKSVSWHLREDRRKYD